MTEIAYLAMPITATNTARLYIWFFSSHLCMKRATRRDGSPHYPASCCHSMRNQSPRPNSVYGCMRSVGLMQLNSEPKRVGHMWCRSTPMVLKLTISRSMPFRDHES
eukprot:835381-Amphidinium_carterae.1